MGSRQLKSTTGYHARAVASPHSLFKGKEEEPLLDYPVSLPSPRRRHGGVQLYAIEACFACATCHRCSRCSNGHSRRAPCTFSDKEYVSSPKRVHHLV